MQIQNKQVFKVPGKVLLSGGYGVLQHENVGLSLAVDCFFYSTYSTYKSDSLIFIINSKQIFSSWKFSYTYEKDELILEQGNQNKYLTSSIETTIRYFKFFRSKQLKKQKVVIELVFDKGFLSDSNEEEGTEKFINYKRTTKQGLGSSACVVVSVTRILCQLYNQTKIDVIRSLSHISNLAAQGKIGSNFDISTAIDGTQLYKNILPKYALQYIQSQCKNNQIFQTVNQIDKLHNMAKYDIILVDLFKGSNTVKMVTGFIGKLKLLNEDIQNRFFMQSKRLTVQLYSILSKQNIDKTKLKNLNQLHRQLQQQYGNLTNTEIQPYEIKQEIDKFINSKDVLYVICPGSGGYDAVAILVQKGQQLDITPKSKRFSISPLGMQQCTIFEALEVHKYINQFQT